MTAFFTTFCRRNVGKNMRPFFKNTTKGRFFEKPRLFYHCLTQDGFEEDGALQGGGDGYEGQAKRRSPLAAGAGVAKQKRGGEIHSTKGEK